MFFPTFLPVTVWKCCLQFILGMVYLSSASQSSSPSTIFLRLIGLNGQFAGIPAICALGSSAVSRFLFQATFGFNSFVMPVNISGCLPQQNNQLATMLLIGLHCRALKKPQSATQPLSAVSSCEHHQTCSPWQIHTTYLCEQLKSISRLPPLNRLLWVQYRDVGA